MKDENEITINSTDEELMAAYETARRNANGEAIGVETDTPAEAVARARETNEIIGMTVIRTIYSDTNQPGTPVFATDTAERLWVVNDLAGPWAIQLADN